MIDEEAIVRRARGTVRVVGGYHNTRKTISRADLVQQVVAGVGGSKKPGLPHRAMEITVRLVRTCTSRYHCRAPRWQR
jgi:hypothetical protein